MEEAEAVSGQERPDAQERPDIQEPADAQVLQTLLDRAMAGDHEAFERFWCEFLKPEKVFPYALKLLKNRHDAEDVAQDTFVYLFDGQQYRHITRRDVRGFTYYVRIMVYNMAMDHFRKRKQTRFVITSQTLEQLRLSGVAEDIIAALDGVQRIPVSRTKFIDILKELLDERFTNWLRSIILKYSRYEYARWEAYTDDIANRQVTDSNPHAEAEYRELLRMAEDVRRVLSDEEWDILRRAYSSDDFSVLAHAKQTGIAASTLYSRLERAREKVLRYKPLQEYWKQE